MLTLARKLSKYKTAAFMLAWGLYLLFFIPAMVDISDQTRIVLNTITGHVYHFVYAVLFLIIAMNVLLHEYSRMDFIFFIISGIILVATYYATGFPDQILFFAFFMAAYNLDGRKLIHETFAIKILVLAIVVGLSLSGVLSDVVVVLPTRVRHYLGFTYTTMGAMIMLCSSIEILWYLGKKTNWIWIVCIAVLNLFFFYMTRTKMVIFVTAILLVLSSVAIITDFRWPDFIKNRFILYLIPVLCCVVSLIFAFTYNPSSELLSKLNSLLTARLQLSLNAINQYGIKLFGQPITWVGATVEGKYNYVDCSYLQLLLTFGPLFLAYAVMIYIKGLKKSFNRKDIMLLIALTITLIYAMTDPQLMTLGNTGILFCAFTSDSEYDGIICADKVIEEK